MVHHFYIDKEVRVKKAVNLNWRRIHLNYLKLAPPKSSTCKWELTVLCVADMLCLYIETCHLFFCLLKVHEKSCIVSQQIMSWNASIGPSCFTIATRTTDFQSRREGVGAGQGSNGIFFGYSAHFTFNGTFKNDPAFVASTLVRFYKHLRFSLNWVA